MADDQVTAVSLVFGLCTENLFGVTQTPGWRSRSRQVDRDQEQDWQSGGHRRAGGDRVYRRTHGRIQFCVRMVLCLAAGGCPRLLADHTQSRAGLVERYERQQKCA